MSEVKGSQSWTLYRGSRGGSFPPLPASGGSRRPSLGWWPPPSHLCVRLHVASPLCPCLSPSVSYKDPVPGFRATPIQGEPDLRPFTPPHLQRPHFQRRSRSEVSGSHFSLTLWGWGETTPSITLSSKQHVIHILFG